MASKARVKLVNVVTKTAAFNSKIGFLIDFQVHSKQIYMLANALHSAVYCCKDQLQGMPSWNKISTPSLHDYNRSEWA
jgi:hypothetical protein